MNKISNTERLAGIIIKILKVIGFVFIGYIIFMIIAVIGLGTYTVVKKDNANVESSATTICSIDNKKYQIELEQTIILNVIIVLKKCQMK